MRERPSTSLWAHGSFAAFSPLELLEGLADRLFTGRLSLAATGRRHKVVTLHLDRGQPVLTVGSGIPRGLSPAEDGYRSRQVLLESLTWQTGRFDLDEGPGGSVIHSHREALGDVRQLIEAARERRRVWETSGSALPDSFSRVFVTRLGRDGGPKDEIETAILAAAETGALSLAEIAHKVLVDEHVVLQSAYELAEAGKIELTLSRDTFPPLKTEIETAVLQLLGLLESPAARTLKITVLSWDSTTSFRAVDALLGRAEAPPEGVEDLAKFHVISETMELGHDLKVEILAFRSDLFDVDFCAPLIQDSHLFLLFSDLDSGHIERDERPLVERINTLRNMFCRASAAGRITIGGSAITDHGCDILLPELGRYYDWDETQKAGFLPGLLNEVSKQLG